MPRYGMPAAGIAPYNNAALYDLMRRTTTLKFESRDAWLGIRDQE